MLNKAGVKVDGRLWISPRSHVIMPYHKILDGLYEEAKGEGATAGKTWRVILAPPSRMERRGLEKGMLKPGASVTVEGYPNRDKPEELRAERIIVNGKTIELR